MTHRAVLVVLLALAAGWCAAAESLNPGAGDSEPKRFEFGGYIEARLTHYQLNQDCARYRTPSRASFIFELQHNGAGLTTDEFQNFIALVDNDGSGGRWQFAHGARGIARGQPIHALQGSQRLCVLPGKPERP